MHLTDMDDLLELVCTYRRADLNRLAPQISQFTPDALAFELWGVDAATVLSWTEQRHAGHKRLEADWRELALGRQRNRLGAFAYSLAQTRADRADSKVVA